MNIKQKGQTLIEILVALSIAAVLVSATSVAVLSALSNAEFAKQQSLASQYADQGIEIIRSMRNNDYSNFQQLSGTYCMASSCNSLVNTSSNACGISTDPTGVISCGQNVSTFVRTVNVSPTNAGATDCNTAGYKVSVNVAWADAKCTDSTKPFCHILTISTCLSNYQIEPTP